ncbi:hypothetical protein GCM10010434_098150 [Winogradskya humida]
MRTRFAVTRPSDQGGHDMATLIGSEGSTIWLVAVLLVLASGLAAALLAAIRDDAAPVRVRAERRPQGGRPIV